MAYRRSHYRRAHYRRNKYGGYSHVRGTYVRGHSFLKTGGSGYRSSYGHHADSNNYSNKAYANESSAGRLLLWYFLICYEVLFISLGFIFIQMKGSSRWSSDIFMFLATMSFTLAAVPLGNYIMKIIKRIAVNKAVHDTVEKNPYAIEEFSSGKSMVDIICDKEFTSVASGYSVSEVDAYLNSLCDRIELEENQVEYQLSGFNWRSITDISFSFEKDGYDPAEVNSFIRRLSVEKLKQNQNANEDTQAKKYPLKEGVLIVFCLVVLCTLLFVIIFSTQGNDKTTIDNNTISIGTAQSGGSNSVRKNAVQIKYEENPFVYYGNNGKKYTKKIKCPKCGTINDGKVKCDNCGYRILDSFKRCKNCGATIKDTFVKCPHCKGSKFEHY